MGRARRKNRPSQPRQIVPREPVERYDPVPGPGQRFVMEGDDDNRHYRNVGEPLDAAWNREIITDDLWSAGNTFRLFYDRKHKSSTDSTQGLNVSGGIGVTGLADSQLEAGRKLAAIEHEMPRRDYRIIEKFCGQGAEMTEAVQRVTPCHPNGIKYRILEALESLDDALEKLHIRKFA